jgi:hypothetical protein
MGTIWLVRMASSEEMEGEDPKRAGGWCTYKWPSRYLYERTLADRSQRWRGQPEQNSTKWIRMTI